MISGSSASKPLSNGLTIEGIGSDATAYGWGIRIKNAQYVEISNIGFMMIDSAEGDNVSLQQSNKNVWVHNCDMFYGAPGGDADQKKRRWCSGLQKINIRYILLQPFLGFRKMQSSWFKRRNNFRPLYHLPPQLVRSFGFTSSTLPLLFCAHLQQLLRRKFKIRCRCLPWSFFIYGIKLF